MKHHEKKYKVDSFDDVEQKLKDLGAKKIKSTTSTHYYVQQKSNYVIKLVHYSDRDEIHILKEANGTFSLAENIPVNGLEKGLQWLRDKGYQSVEVVKMDYVDYEYNDGIVGLYVINDILHSVILDYLPAEHEVIGKKLGLENTEIISVPYNKYLEKSGQLRPIKIVEVLND